MTDRPALRDVLDGYETTLLALERLQATPHAELVALRRFFGLSRSEARAALAQARDELEGHALVGLVAAMEADLRRDLDARDDGVKHDPIREQARTLSTGTDGKPRLEALIDLWRAVTGEAGHGAGSRFKALLHRRHWLAHGRHWPDKSGTPVDAANAWAVIDHFATRIRGVDPKFPRS